MSTKSARRAACDSCHNAKSRCTTEPGEKSCQRCKRLRLDCAYSPYLRMGRPRKRRSEVDGYKRVAGTDSNCTTLKVSGHESGTPADDLRPNIEALESKESGAPGIEPSTKLQPQPVVDTQLSGGTLFEAQSAFDWRQSAIDSSTNTDFPSTTSLSLATTPDDFEQYIWLQSVETDSTLPTFEDSVLPPNVDCSIDANFTKVGPLPTEPPAISGQQTCVADHYSQCPNKRRPLDLAQSTRCKCISEVSELYCMRRKINEAKQQPTNACKCTATDLQSRNPKVGPPGTKQNGWNDEELLRLHLDIQRLAAATGSGATASALDDSTAEAESAGIAPADEIFSATHSLMCMMQQYLPHPGLSSDECSRHVPVRKNQEHYATVNVHNKRRAAHSSKPSSATANILLMLTCYTCLLNVYEPLVSSLIQTLQHIRRSRNVSSTPNQSNSSLFNYQESTSLLPAVNVGSFSFMASPDMNIRLMLHIVLQLLKQMQDTARSCFETPESAAFYGVGGHQSSPYRAVNESILACNHSPMAALGQTALQEIGEIEIRLMQRISHAIENDEL